MKKKHFVYLTTNLINGKQYIGDHSTNNINDNYLGSGRPLFKRAKKKYGRENFKKEILEYFNTKQEAVNNQEKYIKEYNTLIPNGYNINPKGGNSTGNSGMDPWNKGKIGVYSEETKRKISESCKGRIPWNKGKTEVYSEETKRKISESKLGKKRSLKSRRKQGISISGEKNHFFGKHHTKETKEKIRLKNKISLLGNKNGMYGKKHTEEARRKMSENHKGKFVSNKTKRKMSRKRKGENNPNSKLKNIDVKEIRELLKNNINSKEISLKYNIGISTIYNIKNNKSWNNGRFEKEA